jgi:hypothetical protein
MKAPDRRSSVEGSGITPPVSAKLSSRAEPFPELTVKTMVSPGLRVTPVRRRMKSP